ELSFFATSLLPRYFSALEDFGRIDQLLAEDVDARALFAATRLAGAPDPVFLVDTSTQEAAAHPEPPGPPVSTDEPSRDWRRRANGAAAAGNVVRAALLCARTDEGRARAELDRLVERLQRALHLDTATAAVWRQALPALLPRAARGIWPIEARLLY